MNTNEYHRLILVHNLEELAEICKAAGAAISTIIYSTDKVVMFYRGPQTDGIRDTNSVDELHIRHPKNARILIAVFPVENPT
jgi:hypothetical protein